MKATRNTMPDEWVSPEKKAKNNWGLEAAKYIFFSHNRSSGLFYNSREKHRQLRKYALGMQSTDQYKPHLRVDPKNADKSHLGAIRWNIKNYATNLVNIALSKIERRKYDPVAEPNDPLALDEKENFKARIKAYAENQMFLAQMGIEMQDYIVDDNIPEDIMPQTPSEAEVYLQMGNYKIKEAAKLEKAITETLNNNRWDEIVERLCIWDIINIGVGAINTRLDQNGRVQIERIDPSNLIVPFSQTGDFSKIKYAADFQWVSMDELRMINETLGDTELQDIDEKFAQTGFRFNIQDPIYINDSDEHKFQIMRFEYRTASHITYLDKQDIGGNNRLIQKKYGYKGNEHNDGRAVKRQPIQSVYEGYWIVGSEYIFNWKLKNNTEYPNGPFGSAQLGYKVFAANYYDGKVISLVEQMIPVLDSLQTYELKIQEYLASPFPDGIIIDHKALREVAKNMKDTKPEDILELAFQTKVILVDSGAGQYGAGSSYKAAQSLGNGGEMVARYINLIANELMKLERIIGINQVSAAATVSPEMGKGVAEMQMQATEVALDYLYKSKEYILGEMYKSVAILLIQADKYKMGKNEKYRGICKHKYDIKMSARPTEAEWAEFYAEMTESRKAGLISAADTAILRQIQNLKEAYFYLAVVEKRRSREMQQQQQASVEQNAEVQQQSAAAKHQMDKDITITKGQLDMQLKEKDMELEQMKHEHSMEQLEKKELERRITEIEKILEKGMVESKLNEERAEEDRVTKVLTK